MRTKLAKATAVVVMAAAISAATGSPAQADPCGASSYRNSSNGYQSVYYRNCGSTPVNMKGHVNYGWGPCTYVPGASSRVLISVWVAAFQDTWGTAYC